MNFSAAMNYVVSLFIICSPLAAIPAFLCLTAGRGATERKHIALWSSFAVAVILIVTTFIGASILRFLQIQVSAFQCAGGVVVFLLSLSMLNAEISPMRQTEDEIVKKASVSVIPLAMPIMAGPGALSAVIVTAATYEGFYDRLIMTACSICVAGFSALLLYFAVPVEKYLGNTGLNVVTRIGGLILTATSLQLIAKGIIGLFFSS